MQVRKKYDFSSVGELKEDLDKSRSQSASDRAQIPVGIRLPAALGESSDGLLRMHYSVDEALADNFRNMVMTNHGERLGLYDFGANLTELAFELGTDEFDTEAIRRIRRTTEKYMPFIQLLTFEPLVDRNDNKEVAKVGVRITYKVSALSQRERVIEAIVFVAG
jgi:phage baseplate assembly protein W